MTLATTKSLQGGYKTANRGTQTYSVTGIWGFLAETQPKLEDLLQWTVMGGETWVFLFEPYSKWQGMEQKHAMPPNTKYWNSRPLHIKWSCSCFGTEMDQDWNIALTKALLLLLHHTLKYWNQSWRRQFTASAFVVQEEFSLLCLNKHLYSTAATTEAIK